MTQNGDREGLDLLEGRSTVNRLDILSIKNVTISFDGFVVLDDLDFSIGHGEMRFLIGPNGAGKTTLLDVITGKSKADRGTITFDGGLDISNKSEQMLVRLGIGRKFQTPSVFNSLSVYHNLETSARFRNRIIGMFRPLSREQSERIQDTLEITGLTARTDHNAGVLSHGERQWLEIAMLLVQKPKLLLLDEPVAGMTRRERDRTGSLLQEIAKERSVLVVEHDMEFVRQFAQTVTVLHHGKVLSEGTMDMIQQDPQVVRAYLGRSRSATRQEAPRHADSPAGPADKDGSVE